MADDFVIYKSGFVHMSVCTTLPPDEIVARANRESTTVIESCWAIDDAGVFADGSEMPHACERNPSTHRHWLLVC